MSDSASDATHAARSGVIQLLSVVGQALMPAYQVLLARLYGIGTFGVYQASVAIIEVLTRAGLAGAIGGQHRFIAAHRAAGETDLALRALGSGLRLAFSVSGVLALALGVLAPVLARAWHESDLVVALPVMAASIVFSALTLVLVAATLAAKVARMNLYVRGIAEPLLLLTTAVVAWRLGGGVRRIAVAHLVATMLTTGLALVACARLFGWRQIGRALVGPRHPGFVRFAIPMGASDVMNAVLQRADTIIVTTFAGVDALAVYAAAEYVTRVIANPRYVFDPIVAPIISEALAARDRPRVRYNLALLTRWVTTVSTPVAVTIVVLRGEILGLYGGLYRAGAGALCILALAHLVNACLGLTPYVIAMGGRSRLFFLDNLGAAGLNIGLGVILVPRLGIEGAAIAVLISVSALQAALTIEAWVLERVHPFDLRLLKPLLAALAALAVESVLHALCPGATARVLVVIAAGLASYAGALVALGLGTEERRLVAQLLGRLRRKPPDTMRPAKEPDV